MAIPTVFVSSTFYDLKYARESLKRFIENLGYSPVLSEAGAVFYDPKTTAAESCLKEVSNVDIFVLLIGGRYGMELPASGQSVTNAEFQAAVEKKIPVFALVEQGTYNDYALYRANVSKPELINNMSFPNADSPKIFEFIESVQKRANNNALVPFSSTSQIETYLRMQWAGMMHSFLTQGSSEAQVVDTLAVLTNVNERVEVIAEQILRTVGTSTDRLYVRLLQDMVQSSAVSDLRYMNGRPTPGIVLSNETVEDCASELGIDLRIAEHEDAEYANTISVDGSVSSVRMEELQRRYENLRTRLVEAVHEHSSSTEDILLYEKAQTEA
ncbi:DUF4062 domain-containing protein [Arthrobacter sp. 1P04PC]|uniref:DUF4062 domain-containing protein n=1 Tax=unclassified Arthrobacter TaxID=235627 RepID=UPI0039A29F01